MKNNIELIIKTDIGKIRKNNEDSFVELSEIFGNPNIVLAGAIDGVGGYAGGEIAAKIAKDTIEKIVKENETEEAGSILKKAFSEANNAIVDQRFHNPVLHKMSCVLSIAILNADADVLHYVHCGDSRAYIFRNKELIKITKDHSLVGFMEDNGDLLEEDAMKHPRRNEISKLLGEKELDENSNYFDSGEHSFNPNDIALFCSDGLSDLVNRASIIDTLNSDKLLDEKCQELIDKANDLGGKDNITVALVHYKNEKKTGKEGKVLQHVIVPIETETKIKSKKKNIWLLLLLFIFLTMGLGLLWYLLLATETTKKDIQNCSKSLFETAAQKKK